MKKLFYYSPYIPIIGIITAIIAAIFGIDSCIDGDSGHHNSSAVVQGIGSGIIIGIFLIHWI